LKSVTNPWEFLEQMKLTSSDQDPGISACCIRHLVQKMTTMSCHTQIRIECIMRSHYQALARSMSSISANNKKC
jgi:hypothetical protein